MSFYLYNEFPEVIEDPDRASIFLYPSDILL